MKDVFVKMRATKDEREQVAKLASKKGMTVSEYLRHLIMKDQLNMEVR
ncbi:MAG: plasmid mobilization protein [Clostridium sp.]